MSLLGQNRHSRGILSVFCATATGTTHTCGGQQGGWLEVGLMNRPAAATSSTSCSTGQVSPTCMYCDTGVPVRRQVH